MMVLKSSKLTFQVGICWHLREKVVFIPSLALRLQPSIHLINGEEIRAYTVFVDEWWIWTREVGKYLA
jgi:hypothetical protein